MKTVEIKGFIFAKPNWNASEMNYEFSMHDYEAWAKNPELDRDGTWKQYRKVSEHIIVIEAPEFDPKRIVVEALEAHKIALRAELGRRIAEIEDEISKLTAIEYTPAPEFATDSSDIPL